MILQIANILIHFSRWRKQRTHTCTHLHTLTHAGGVYRILKEFHTIKSEILHESQKHRRFRTVYIFDVCFFLFIFDCDRIKYNGLMNFARRSRRKTAIEFCLCNYLLMVLVAVS